MLKLGKLTDYAVALTVQLSRENARASHSASHLAEKTGLPEPTVAKVLKKLSQSKIVESVRGASGGYRLARTPAEISICDVIEAMDGPIAITSCIDENDQTCSTGAQCPTRGKWAPVNMAIRKALRAVSIADMEKNSGACAVTSHLIRVSVAGTGVNS